jgi:GTP pyrophosphokinase
VTKEKPDEKESQEISPKEIFKVTEEVLQKNCMRADCCHPIPGDDILGYLEQENKMVLHKRQCTVAVRLKSRYGNRIVATEWNTNKNALFLVTIYMRGIDHVGVLNEVTSIVSKELNFNIKKVNIGADNGIFDGKLQLYVHDTNDVKQICNSLLKVNDVKSVIRIAD